jgi:hypothetical protein
MEKQKALVGNAIPWGRLMGSGSSQNQGMSD